MNNIRYEGLKGLMKKKWLAAAVFCVLLTCSLQPAQAQFKQLGIDPFNLDYGGGRPLGMGAAFVGLADDVNAALYNPGGLAWAKGISLTLSDSDSLSAIQAYPTGYGASFGLAVLNNVISGIPIPAGDAYSSSNLVVLSFGTKLNFIPAIYEIPFFQRLGVGANIKGLVGQKLRRTGQLDRSATGWDMDLGLLWKGAEWWSVGLSGQNILPAGTFGSGGLIRSDINQEEGIPAVGKIGASAKVIGDIYSPIYMEGDELVLGAEVDVANSKPVLFRLGGEWGFSKTFFLRAGLMQQYKGDEVSSDINFGAGYRTQRWGIDLASYQEPLSEQRYYCVSLLYFPEEWVVVRELEIEKPMLLIKEPIERISLEDNIVTYDDKIEIVGKAKPGVDVYINGLETSQDPDHTFRAVVPLRLGKNLIVVEARYDGEKKTWNYKVLRKAKVKIADEEKVPELEKKREKVEELVTMGVIELSPGEELQLEVGITRGELASWLVNAANLPLPAVEKDLFPDVPKDHPLAPYIKAVVDAKLMFPFPDGTFRPQAIVTKEEGDAIFKRIEELK
jgi:hypothetical protein